MGISKNAKKRAPPNVVLWIWVSDVLCSRIRDLTIPKILDLAKWQSHTLSDTNVDWHKFMWECNRILSFIKYDSLIFKLLLPQNVNLTKKHERFPKTVKSCSF